MDPSKSLLKCTASRTQGGGKEGRQLVGPGDLGLILVKIYWGRLCVACITVEAVPGGLFLFPILFSILS